MLELVLNGHAWSPHLKLGCVDVVDPPASGGRLLAFDEFMLHQRYDIVLQVGESGLANDKQLFMPTALFIYGRDEPYLGLGCVDVPNPPTTNGSEC